MVARPLPRALELAASQVADSRRLRCSRYRKIAVDTLLEICESQPNRQFIFITPQDMHPFLKGRETMPRVIKMNDVRPAAS